LERWNPTSAGVARVVDAVVRSGDWGCSSTVAPCLGVDNARSGSFRRPLEVFASPSRSGVTRVVSRVVLNDLALRIPRQLAENADVRVGHDRVPGCGIRIETATAWGSSCGRSSGPKRRKPKVLCRLEGCGGSAHLGQATMYADAAGVKRNRQRGQQRWVMRDPFDGSLEGFARGLGLEPAQTRRLRSRRVLARKAASARRADAVHHGSSRLEFSSSKYTRWRPPPETPQDVPAGAAIGSSAVSLLGASEPLARLDQRSAGHFLSALPLRLPPSSDQRSPSTSSRLRAGSRRAMTSTARSHGDSRVPGSCLHQR
jgi:hypothetical protein